MVHSSVPLLPLGCVIFPSVSLTLGHSVPRCAARLASRWRPSSRWQVGTHGVLSGLVGTPRVPIEYLYSTPRVPLQYSGGTELALLRHCAWYSRRIRACLVAHACAVDYVLGPANTNACLAGSKITTEVTCRVAAGFVGKPYGGNTSFSYFPSGCYLNTAAAFVYLNTHPTGGTAASAQPLCKGTGAPPPPPPPPPPAHTSGVTPWGGVPRAVVPR